MKRKIIKLGQATYVTSLPSKWMRQHHLDKGDYLEVEENEGSLVMSTKKIEPHLETTIDLDNFNERTIRNILNQTYRKGFDTIRLQYKRSEQLDIIRDLVRNILLGFEIVKEDKTMCVLENIAEPSVEKYDVILRKLFLMVKTEAEEIVEEIEGKKSPSEKRRLENKNLIDSYTNFIRRLIIKYRLRGPRDSYLLYHAISFLSLIHHAYFYLYMDIQKQKKVTISKESIALLKETNEMYASFYNAFHKNDFLLAHEVGVKRQQLLYQRLQKLLQTSSGFENVVLCHVSEIIRMIQMASTIIFGFTEIEKL